MSIRTEDIKAAIALLDAALHLVNRAENEAGWILNKGTLLVPAKDAICRAGELLVKEYDKERKK
jgi:hypothetical protein